MTTHFENIWNFLNLRDPTCLGSIGHVLPTLGRGSLNPGWARVWSGLCGLWSEAFAGGSPSSRTSCWLDRKSLLTVNVFFSKCFLHYRHILSASRLLFFFLPPHPLPLWKRPPLLSYWSYWGEVKVVVDLHQRYVELGDLEDTCGFVGGWV